MNQNHLGLSILRVQATFSVIIIHVSAPILGEYGKIPLFYWHVGNFFDGVSRYSVPVFFMISGALLLNQNYPLKKFLKKRFVKVLPPFIFWSLVYSAVKRFVKGNEQFDFLLTTDKVIRDVFYGSEYHLWFVFVLMGIYLITPVISRWVKNVPSSEVLFFLLVWLFTLIIKIPGIGIYFPKIDLIYFSGYIGYFVLGYYLLNLNLKIKWHIVLLYVFGVFVTVYGMFYFTERNGKLFNYFYDFLSVNTLLVATTLFLLVKDCSIQNKKIKRLIINISNCCFGVYLMHVLVLELFNMLRYDWRIITPIISVPVVSISCFFVSIFIVYSIRKIKYGTLVTG
ncbi:acyltransferase family protein [Tamlana fucoidanivorans]|uniref:Acyltransferase 3 domain-containing protein n=1 Tax=Allotamlana fucoidanivorans TaxID=2583814 RepID=A0A5C4SNS9_9FLAO|nr:acyltransferase family protein [Tamlana fucoidanivorans]TNJ45768.1 hypothetical protein FGF67_05140 [Tamlana fucoidanivorans]